MKDQSKKTYNKILTLEQLASSLEVERSCGSRITQCHGVFDLLHIGHIRHFEQAKKFGDILVVTVTPDEYVNKGPHRPAFPQDFRIEAIAALECVDYVAVTTSPTAVDAILALKPHTYAKGAEYRNHDEDVTGQIVNEEKAVLSVGGSIGFTDDAVVFSSTNLINRHLSKFPKSVQDHLSALSDHYSIEDVLRYLDHAKDLKVLVLGEAIIDDYQYAETIGSPSKEPILATRYLSSEKFAGGILAVANHVASFCDTVDMITFLGLEDSQEDFIRQQIQENVNPIFLYKEGSPTIVKRRVVESYLLRKLFEIYVMNNDDPTDDYNQELCSILEEKLHRYDVVIVADYGHGMLTPDARSILCKKAPFLAVNTQTNAGNRGFNTIAKYDRSDFVSLTRYELALEERLIKGDIKGMILDLSARLKCAQVMVTLGKDGNICYRRSDGFSESPALASQIVDTMGAGDAVLALSSLYMAQKAPIDLVGFISNVVGAQAVATLGHTSFIEKLGLYRHIEALLK